MRGLKTVSYTHLDVYKRQAKVADAAEDVCECAKADEQEAEQAEVTAETAEA